MPKTITIQREDVVLDALLWRLFGVRGRRLLEETYELNPGLASRDLFLPIGTQVLIPDLPAETAAAVKIITLFG
jgi:phage tail protein X